MGILPIRRKGETPKELINNPVYYNPLWNNPALPHSKRSDHHFLTGITGWNTIGIYRVRAGKDLKILLPSIYHKGQKLYH